MFASVRPPNGVWCDAAALLRAIRFAGLLAPGGCYAGLGVGGGAQGATAADGSTGGDASVGGETGAEAPTASTHGGLRRLSVAEYNNALRDLIGDDAHPGTELLPSDALTPFDNDYLQQAPSEALVVGAEKSAIEAADRLLADPARLEALAGCAPAAADDRDCLEKLAARLGRRAFRRPVTPEEIDAYAAVVDLGVEAESWHVAAAAVVRGMLQDPNFLYRIEIGEPVAGDPDVIALNDWEIATRLSFFLWRTIPDDDLLDLADAGKLSSAADVRDVATQMLADERARDGITQFHALWLGYSGGATDGLKADMIAESNALVEQVVVDGDTPWLSLFTSTETFVTPALAAHYGLPAPAGGAAGWVDYGDSKRGGVMSHGTVLAWGAKFGDTSPTVRGKEIAERFLCTVIPPPPAGQNTDDPPGGADPSACKAEHYAVYQNGGCQGCHGLMDGIGFGLENFAADGTWREHDVNKPQCLIAGEGSVPNIGSFNGPAELGALIASDTSARSCAMRQLYRFASGRSDPDELDKAFLEALTERLDGAELNLRALMIEIAASDEMRFRAIGEDM